MSSKEVLFDRLVKDGFCGMPGAYRDSVSPGYACHYAWKASDVYNAGREICDYGDGGLPSGGYFVDMGFEHDGLVGCVIFDT